MMILHFSSPLMDTEMERDRCAPGFLISQSIQDTAYLIRCHALIEAAKLWYAGQKLPPCISRVTLRLETTPKTQRYVPPMDISRSIYLEAAADNV